jgi:hypothetical protein
MEAPRSCAVEMILMTIWMGVVGSAVSRVSVGESDLLVARGAEEDPLGKACVRRRRGGRRRRGAPYGG